jgi:hypothetical protein
MGMLAVASFVLYMYFNQGKHFVIGETQEKIREFIFHFDWVPSDKNYIPQPSVLQSVHLSIRLLTGISISSGVSDILISAYAGS